MIQADTAESPRIEIDKVSGPAPLAWRDVLLAVLPMGIMAGFLMANRLLWLGWLGTPSGDMPEINQPWSPLFQIIVVILPLATAAFGLIMGRAIPAWLLPALGIAITVLMMNFRYYHYLPRALVIALRVLIVVGSLIALVWLHKHKGLPTSVWVALAVVLLLEWYPTALNFSWTDLTYISIITHPPQLAAGYPAVWLGDMQLTPIITLLTAINAWMGRRHGILAAALMIAPCLMMADYTLYYCPVGLNDRVYLPPGDLRFWCLLYAGWAGLILVLFTTRKPQQALLTSMAGTAALAVSMTVLPARLIYNSRFQFAYELVDAARLFQIGMGVFAAAAVCSAAVGRQTLLPPIQDNPFYRLVTSQRRRVMSRASRVMLFRIIAAVGWIGFFVISGMYMWGSQVIGPDAAPIIAMATVVAMTVGLIGLLLVSQVLIPTFLALATVRRLIPLLSSEMFTLAQITNQSAEQITSGLDAGMHKRLRITLIGYGVLLVILIPRIDLLSVFHWVDGNINIEVSVALRIGLFGMALVGIRLGTLFTLVRRDLTEGQLAAGFVVLIGTLFLIAVPLPPASGGLPYIAGLILIAFSPYVIANRVMQATNWLLDRSNRRLSASGVSGQQL